MRKLLLTITALLMTIAISADDAKNKESRRRIDHLCELYNQDLNDSLIRQAPLDLAFHKEQKCWEHYYETWMHLVNTYTFMGKVNTALQEVKQMHADATQNDNRYGLALANYAMGNAYLNMGRSRIFPWHTPLTAIATHRTGNAPVLIQRFCILDRKRKSDLTLHAALT